MGDSNYKTIFVSEAREQLDNLNEGILNLEKEPENQEYVHQIFRACHTLKGNSAMMGYLNFSNLAHKMENVLGKIRDNEIKVNQEIIDTLFHGSDLLVEGMDQIMENSTDENFDAEEIIEELKTLCDAEQSVIDANINFKDIIELTDEQKELVKEETENSMNVYRIITTLNSDNPLNCAKVQILMRKTGDVFTNIIYSNPSFDDIKDGKVKEGFEIVASTEFSREELEEIMGSVADIESHVLDLDEKFEVVEKETKTEDVVKKKKVIQKKDLLKNFAQPIQSIKIDVKKLDNLVNMVGELLIANMRLNQISKDVNSSTLKEVINNIEMLTSNIQDEVMQQRMVPCGQVFNRFPRLVRDLATKEEKKIDLTIRGEEIELDRNILDEIGEPMVHIIRNAVDHGIESLDDRINNGKSELGKISISASRDKNFAIIEVKDDGGGIDTNKVVNSAVKKGLLSAEEANNLSDQKKLMLIFQPGLSTKDKITDVSGRGVGMDVVLTKIKKLGGNVKIDSTLKQGTSIKIQLPLTLAIISSLLVGVENEKYAIPLSNVIETVDVKKDKIQTIQGNEVFVFRGEEVPLIRLNQFFSYASSERKVYPVVITEESDRKVGLIVDEIINQQTILIKNLHRLVQGVKGIAGGTILGDGKVCLILDIRSIEN